MALFSKIHKPKVLHIRAPLDYFIKEAASSAIMMFIEHCYLIWKTGIMYTGSGRNEIEIKKKKLWPCLGIINNYSVKKDPFMYFIVFLVFVQKSKFGIQRYIHLSQYCCCFVFLNASSNISRMALEYTQKHTLSLNKRRALRRNGVCFDSFYFVPKEN